MNATLEQLEADPHPFLAQLRPIGWVDALGGWVVSGRDLAVRVLRDAETFTVDDPRFSTARVVGPSMLSLDGAEHARHRAPFAPPLRFRPVRERYTGLVAREVDALIDGFDGGRAELRRELAGPLAARVVAHLLGIGADTDAMLGWYDAIVDSVSGVGAGREPTEAGARAFAQLRAAVAPELEENELTEEERVSNAAVMLFGGIETTEGMITNYMWHLLTHDARPSANALEESLRLEPAAAVVDRYATRDAELDGAQVRAGDFVEVSLAGANRDPAYFADPDRFDPERENARLQLAFAHGPHVCVGLHLARLEARVAAERLFERLPGLRLAAPTAPRGLVFRKPPRLEVEW